MFSTKSEVLDAIDKRKCQIIFRSLEPSFFLDEKERKNQDKNMLQPTSSTGSHFCPPPHNHRLKLYLA